MVTIGFDYASVQQLHYFLALHSRACSSIYFTFIVGLQSTNPMDTPVRVNVKYICDDEDFFSNHLLYQQLMDISNYLTITRSDISLILLSKLISNHLHIQLWGVDSRNYICFVFHIEELHQPPSTQE